MKNAHTRIGTIEFTVDKKKTSTRVRAHFDRFAKDGDQTHMVSLFVEFLPGINTEDS
jgi:hypothetical protein